MLAVFSLVLLVASLTNGATYSTIQFSSCDPNAAIQLKSLDVSPMPVGIPGEIEISFNANVASNITGPASLQLKLNQERRFFSPRIPCLGNIGSCKYDNICTMLDRMENEDWLGMAKDIAVQIKAMIKEQLGITAMCPVATGNYVVEKAKIKLPTIPKILSMFASGDYAANIRVEDTTGTLMCLDVKLSVEDKGKFIGK